MKAAQKKTANTRRNKLESAVHSTRELENKARSSTPPPAHKMHPHRRFHYITRDRATLRPSHPLHNRDFQAYLHELRTAPSNSFRHAQERLLPGAGGDLAASPRPARLPCSSAADAAPDAARGGEGELERQHDERQRLGKAPQEAAAAAFARGRERRRGRRGRRDEGGWRCRGGGGGDDRP